MSDHAPIIGITMGDGAGIGPEVIVKALVDPVVGGFCRPLVIGDPRQLLEEGAGCAVDAARCRGRRARSDDGVLRHTEGFSPMVRERGYSLFRPRGSCA